MKVIWILFSLISSSMSIAASLEEVSVKINQDLPIVYDHITKLRKTTVENNNLIYHFIVDANQKEFDGAMPKAKKQVMSTICSRPEASVLKVQKANIVYRYENVKGQSLGEFMIRPEYCGSLKR